MKKIFNLIALSIASIAMIAGCAKFDNFDRVSKMTNSNGEYAIVFSNSPATKATVSPVSNQGYDEFSLYAWNSNSEVIMNPFTVQADGSDAYKYDGVNGQTLQYFKNNAENYSFIGVIPSTTATLNNNSVTVGVESFVVDDKKAEGSVKADSPKEFLWAYTNVEKANYNHDVTLPFKHGNALLYLGFISDDAATEILNYTPYNPGTTGTAAWDETVDVTTYQMTATTVPTQGPAIADINITDEDIAYINDKYTATKGFAGYATQNVITGSLDEDMYAYLVSKYPALSTATLNNWESYVTNPIYRLIHIDKTGQYDTYVGVFVNVQNVNWTNGTTTQTVIHHDAIPAVPATGCEGIRVFSAGIQSEHYVHVAHTNTADATVSTALAFSNRATSTDVIPFSLPEGTVPVGTTEAEAVYSPTTFYAIPGDTGLTHFVVKLSYTYKGTTVYDVRVPITLPGAGLEAGKYYKYIINITSTGNGTNSQDEANNEKDEIDVVNNPISVVVTVDDYGNGHTQVITI